jgi:hypothetical protein
MSHPVQQTMTPTDCNIMEGLETRKALHPSYQFLPTNHFSNVVTRPFNTSSESNKSVHGLAVLKASRESSLQAGEYRSLLVDHCNRSPTMIHDRTNMKPSLDGSNTSHGLIASNSNTTLCHPDKYHALITPETNATTNCEESQADPLSRLKTRGLHRHGSVDLAIFTNSRTPVFTGNITLSRGLLPYW